mgnify:CR=1 FL=1
MISRIANGIVRVGMNLEEDSVNTDSECGTHEVRHHCPIASGYTYRCGRLLNGVGCVKDDRVTELPETIRGDVLACHKSYTSS